MNEIYDVVIIGGDPGGITAGVKAADRVIDGIRAG
jgi:thioredoxin reductase